MPLVPAKCTQCGANLNVDPSHEAAICPHCKTPFITEKAINNFHTTNITNIEAINADTVNIMDSNSAEHLYKAGETLLHLNDFESAKLKFEEMCDRFPYDERGWYGLLQTLTTNFTTAEITIEFYSNLIDIFKKYCIVGNLNNIKLNNMRNCRNFILRVGEMIYEQQIKNRISEINEAEVFVESLKKDKKRFKDKIDTSIIMPILNKVWPEKKNIHFDTSFEQFGSASYWSGYIESAIYDARKQLQPKIEALKTNNDRLEMITTKYIK